MVDYEGIEPFVAPPVIVATQRFYRPPTGT